MITQDGGDGTTSVFACAVLGDVIEGIFYMNMTGTFHTISLEDMQAYSIAQNYDANAIILKPIPGLKDETTTKAFEEVFGGLKQKDTNQHLIL